MISKNTFVFLLGFFAALFTVLFAFIVVPPLIQDFRPIAALAAGFVNPYSTGYSLDVIVCWCILATWIAYESNRVKGGWICLLLGLAPGVAVGFALYLILRARHIGNA